MKKKSISMLLLILLIVIILVTGCSRRAVEEVAIVEESYVPVEIETVKKETIASKVLLNGRVRANEEVMVMPQMPGTVTRVNMKLGDYVAKDQVLMVMDQKDIQRSIEQAEHSVELAKRGVEQAENGIRSAKIQYESTKERLEDALVNLERIKALYEAGAVPKTQLEQAELAASTKPLETAEAQVYQAEIGYQQALNQLSQAESGYEQARSNLDNTLVKAPINGMITNLTVVEGQLASNAQAAATIVDMDTVYLQIDVAENMVNRLRKEQEVAVTIASALDEEITGKIDYISPTADDRTQLYTVKVYINNKDRKIRPGMSGSVGLSLEERQNVLVVRSGAIMDKEEETVVYLVKDEEAVEQKITLGLDTGLYIEVTEGLEEGDIVIIKGQHYVVDGQRVKVVRGE
ncbi:efflux RND transporter periplasmic adaptor subunit [Clostridium formicaceticum]|uniref:Efflux transporter periplasmic adaptor subunit n=1 Tax=Clostridium formicaceticum TaxID=1497 RepID=A0AAC9RP64_9CLOT|nr:efflux RND transporter periplasmic adaptor subunit [Clostridium formicaceticum]AOY78123.1 efflux transporter periplasmic adaptor subunit [Clostridium formicaceticum]ARE88773.1 Macrolide export protein MacA [Clostridium formicaceticum]